MSIQKLATYAGALMVACFLAVLATSQLAMQRLKVNGPIYNDIERSKDVVADVLPPPKYIIEPYLEASLALIDPASVDVHQKRLDELRRVYDIRQTYWLGQPLEEGVKKNLTEKSHASAEAFWNTLDKSFLPALKQNDLAAAKTAYADLSRAYDEHRKAIDEVVTAANANVVKTEAAAQSDVSATLIAVWTGSLGLLALLAGGIWALLKNVIAPLRALAGRVGAVADGGAAGEIPFLGRNDEIGDLAHALKRLLSKGTPRAASAPKAQPKATGESLDALAERELKALEERIARQAEEEVATAAAPGAGAQKTKGAAKK